MKRSDALRRRPARIQPKPRFLVVCEGTVTEPCYFQDVRHIERSLIELQIEPGGTPKTVVKRAVSLKNQANRDAIKQKDDNLKYDEVWCVFDIDEHPLVPEAKQQARANDIKLAISNPCFELWALLHFQDQSAHIDRAKVQHLCKSHMPGYEKRLSYEILRPKYPEAHQRAEGLEKWHVSRGTVGSNPSTMVHRLVERIMKARQTPY